MLRFVVALAYLIVASSAARGAHSHVDGFDQRQLRDWSPSFPHYSPTTSEDKPVYVPTDKKEDKPVYVPTDRTEDKPVYTPTCSGKKCDAPVYVPTYSMPVDPPSDDKPVYSPVTKTNKPTLSPTYEPTKMLTLIPTPAPTSRQPTKYPPTGASVAPTPRPTNSPSENPLTPSNPTAPVSIPMPTTPVPSLVAPSDQPSIAPTTTAAVVFINELGTKNGIGFVEVAYSSFLGPGIGTYSIFIYSVNGDLIDSESLSEGTISLNGLTFTFITYPSEAEAFALVDDSDMTVLYFLSSGEVVAAADGPAEGMMSTDINDAIVPTPTPTTITPTYLPSVTPSTSLGLPSSAPSRTPIVIFFNELGTTGGSGFVEVAYSSFLGPGIETYSIAIYDIDGVFRDTETLSEGTSSADGLTFTFIIYPDYGHAFALVDNSDMIVLVFLSNTPKVVARDGPAEGMLSNDILFIGRRTLQDSDTSFGLSGSGCDFEDFVFAEGLSTPGEVNVDQEITECNAPDPTSAPTPLPTEQIGSALSEGVIIGIAVGGFVLCLLCIILGCDFKTNRKKRRSNDDAHFYWEEEEELGEQGGESVGDGFIED